MTENEKKKTLSSPWHFLVENVHLLAWTLWKLICVYWLICANRELWNWNIKRDCHISKNETCLLFEKIGRVFQHKSSTRKKSNFAPEVNRQPWLPRGRLVEKAIACEHPWRHATRCTMKTWNCEFSGLSRPNCMKLGASCAQSSALHDENHPGIPRHQNLEQNLEFRVHIENRPHHENLGPP